MLPPSPSSNGPGLNCSVYPSKKFKGCTGKRFILTIKRNPLCPFLQNLWKHTAKVPNKLKHIHCSHAIIVFSDSSFFNPSLLLTVFEDPFQLLPPKCPYAQLELFEVLKVEPSGASIELVRHCGKNYAGFQLTKQKNKS